MDIVLGVTQGSILGLLFFNISLADLFFTVFSMDIANYANDNTSYATANIDSLIASLEETSESSFTWFDNNLMKIMLINATFCSVLMKK